MLYLTCSMIPSVDLARYGISRAADMGTEGLCVTLYRKKQQTEDGFNVSAVK